MARRLLGSATTNNLGVATLNYTGLGVGKLDVIAVTTIDGETTISEKKEIIDCLKFDDGSSTYANTFSNETNILTRSNTGATVYYDNTSGTSTFQLPFASVLETGTEVAIDMDILECSYVGLQTGRYETGASTQYESLTLENQTGKLHIEILEDRTVFYLDNTLLKEQTANETNLEKVNFFFRCSAGRIMSLKYTDLMVYPI